MPSLSRLCRPRFRVLSLCVLALGLVPAAAAGGDIVGRVELIEKNGKKAADLSDVVVYVETAKARARPATEVVSMKGKAFSPHVIAVGVGSTVNFPNEDPILHNVFSVSGEGFDLGLYKRPRSGSRTFDKPGVYTLYCNIHPQMSAQVIVRENPFFTKAAKDGAFRIEGLPAGGYKIIAFHERAGEGAPVAVKVPSTGEATADLSLDATSYKRVQHKNKFGKDYSLKVY